MIGVSARSYVAAGLATAIAGAMVATPVLARTQVSLPPVPSANVELSAFVSFAERTAAQAMSEAAVEITAAKNAATSVGPAPQETPAGVMSSLLQQAAATPSVANGAATVPSPSTNHASNTLQGSSSVNAPAATAATLSPLQAIIALPLLLSAIPVIVTAQALETTGEDAAFGTVDVLAGLALGNTTEVNDGFALIGNTFGDFAKATMADFAALEAQLAPFDSDTASSANVVASVLKSPGAVTPSSSAVTKTPATTAGTLTTTTTTDTKASTSSTSRSSTAATHQTDASSVTAAVKTRGATKTDSAATTSAPSATTVHVGQPSASSASVSAPKHASAGVSAPAHKAAHAKGGK
jgi:hypothetical protein